MSQTIKNTTDNIIKQSQEISRKKSILNKNKDRYSKITRNDSTIKSSFNYTSEYEYPNFQYSEDYEDVIMIWKNWEVNVGKVPIDFVPFIQANILTKSEGGIDYEDSLKLLDFGQFFNIVKTFKLSTNGNIIATCGFNHRCIQGIKLFKVALNVQFFSPLDYY